MWCGRDGFFGKIVGHVIMTRKKQPCTIWRSIHVNDYVFHWQGECISDFSIILKFPKLFSEIAFGAI